MKARLAVGAVGVGCMIFAVIQLLRGGIVTSWFEVAKYMLGLVLLHDVVFAALVAVLGWLLTKALPPRPRAVVQGGLFVAVCAVVISVPLLTGRGGHGNATVDPLDYRRNLLLVLVAIAVATAALAAARSRRR